MNFVTKFFLFIFITTVSLQAVYYWEKPQLISSAGRYGYNPISFVYKGDVYIIWEEQDSKNSYLMSARRNKIDKFEKTTIFKESDRYFYQLTGINIDESNVRLAAIAPNNGILIFSGNLSKNDWKLEGRVKFKINEVFNPKLFYDYEVGLLYLFYLINENGILTINYQISDDLGKNWKKSDISISTEKDMMELNQLYFPAITSLNGKLYVFYQKRNPSGGFDNDDEIFVTIINGNEKKDLRITEDIFNDFNPKVESRDGIIYLMWNRFKSGKWEVTLRELAQSNDSLSLGNEIIVSSSVDSAEDPKIFFQDDRLRFMWTVFSDNFYQIKGRDYLLDSQTLVNEFFYVKNNQNSVHSRVILSKGVEYLTYMQLSKEGTTSVVFVKPDETVPTVRIVKKPPEIITDISDLVIRWEKVNDSSGIVGYAYSLGRTEKDDPISVNLTVETTSLVVSRLVEQGKNYFHIRAIDKAGNAGKVTTIALNVIAGSGEVSKEYSRYLKLFKDKKYTTIIKKQRHPKFLDLQYLKGLSYFALSRDDNIKNERRIRCRDYAVKNLKEVSEKAYLPELRAKSRLWYGFTLHYHFQNNKKYQKEALFNLFYIIKNEEFKKTTVYNDAIFYAAIIYAENGEYERAKKYFRLLISADRYDNRVYNIKTDTYLSVREASKFGTQFLQEMYYKYPTVVP